ncbi:MAG: hypothetical protein IPM47_20510 [Sphingobacteriales bacterium]|nr:MAG: hypothetical protein IPM47_20510 [Sphingobacteriales bacterium]
MPIQKLSPNFEASVGVEANNYQYNGKELNEDFGLHWSHHEYRWLDLQTNKWTSIDPLADKNNSVSSYSFVHNNPIRYRDPYGLDTLPTFTITATKINKTHSEHIWWHMKQGNQRMVKSTKGNYKPILFGPRNTSGIGDYAYQEGLGTLSYPIMATLSGAGLAIFMPALLNSPPLLAKSNLSIYAVKAIASGSAQGIITGQIDIPDLLGDTFLTPIYSGLLGGFADATYSLKTGNIEIDYFGPGGTKSGSNFLIDFGFSTGVGLYHSASENMFKSFVTTEAKTTPLLLYHLPTSPIMSGVNYGGGVLTKSENK